MRLAPWITLQNEKRVVVPAKGAYVAVLASFMQEALAGPIALIAVDEAWYLDANQDVAAAVRQGTLSGAAEHYRQSGYFENRMPYSIMVDEVWYLEEYPDVQQAVEGGTIPSAQAHFDAVGYAEGRMPYPGFALRMAD